MQSYDGFRLIPNFFQYFVRSCCDTKTILRQTSGIAPKSVANLLQKLYLLLYHFESFLHHRIVLVEDGEVFTHVPEVAGDEGFQLHTQIGERLL